MPLLSNASTSCTTYVISMTAHTVVTASLWNGESVKQTNGYVIGCDGGNHGNSRQTDKLTRVQWACLHSNWAMTTSVSASATGNLRYDCKESWFMQYFVHHSKFSFFDSKLSHLFKWVIFFQISQFICNLYTYIKYNQQIVCWEARAGRGVLCSTSPW
jgi:hypothetical protein